MAGSLDVFFSYSRRDHAAVERVARDLSQRGLHVFLDRWYLTPGQPWPQALEQGLSACDSVAVFIGADGLGPWQQRERDLALDRQAGEPGFPVIPVLLTRCDPGLGFLKLNTWVDLSDGLRGDEALAVLCAAIRREPPGPRAAEHAAALRAAVCPYRGLRPFREEDEPFFFGRDTFARTLNDALARQSFVAVVGGSGTGKSSVVRAGLIPRLRRAEGGLVWDALTFFPTDRPLHSLAAALLPALEPDLSEVDSLAEVGKLAMHLADGAVSVRDIAERVLEKQSGTDRLLLFVDQWEELYTLCPDDAVRRIFIDQLLQAAATERVRVVMTLRGDFMGQTLASRALCDRLQDAVVNVGPMSRDELAETISRPAEKTGLTFEQGLVEAILDDVGDEPGTLPLLEFLLEGLWAERRGCVLTRDAYERLGRVAGAIAHRAEEVFEQKLSEAERQAAQRLLTRMVRPGEGVGDTRRRATFPADDPVVAAIVRKLTQERLIVTERDAGSGAVTVEVAHEALIRRWQRLRGWVDHDREFLRTRERIAAHARLWEAEGRPPDRLLSQGRPLAEGEDLLAKRRADLDQSLVEYLEASAAAALGEKEARRAIQRRRLRSARLAAAAMGVLALIALGGGIFAWSQRQAAHRNAAAAELSAEEAKRNASRALAALASAEAAAGSPATALRVALAAIPEDLARSPHTYASEAQSVIRASLHQLRELRRFTHDDSVNALAFSPDSGILATGSSLGAARLWDVSTGELIGLSGDRREGWVNSVAFSPDGRVLASSFGKTARVWELATRKEIADLRGHDDGVNSVAFSPDGRTLATGSDDHTLRLWDAQTGRQLRSVEVGTGVDYIAYSPDGRMLATVLGDDKAARLWDAASGRMIVTLLGHEDVLRSVAFSPDGRLLATGAADGTARLWDVETGKEMAVLRGHESDVNSVAFSPDGRLLATGSMDGTARLWDRASGEEIDLLWGHKGGVAVVAFSPDGRMLATGSSDNAARLWDIEAGWEISAFRGHDKAVHSVAFNSDGRFAVTGSADRTARLWDVETVASFGMLQGHGEAVLAARISPDGQIAATASTDSTARLWEVATGKETVVFRGHRGPVQSINFSPDGRTLATASADRTARLWTRDAGKEIVVLRGHEGSVWAITFSRDGRLIATTSEDRSARLWEAATGREISTLHGHDAGVASAAFSPDGRTLATGSMDGTARLWEVATGKEIMVARGHAAGLEAVAFSHDGRTLATASADKTVRLWEVSTGKEVASLPHGQAVLSVAFCPDGRTLATGSMDGTARLWPVGQALIDLACARVHTLALSERDKARFGIDKEWCTPDVSAALRAKLVTGRPAAAQQPATTAAR